MRFTIKRIILLLALFSLSSCAYKHRKLVNINYQVKNSNYNECFVLAPNIQNQQNIYHVIDNGWEDYPGQKELSFTYDLSDFLTLQNPNCSKEIFFEINKIHSNELHYSDTGANAHGFKINASVRFIKDGKIITAHDFKIEDRGEYYSTLVATKKRIDREMVKVMNLVFNKFIRQVSNFASNLE